MFLLSVHLSFGSSESLPLASNSSRTLINLLFHCLVLPSSIVLIFLCTILDTLNCSAFSQFQLKWNRRLPAKIYSASCCDSILTIYIIAASRSLAGPARRSYTYIDQVRKKCFSADDMGGGLCIITGVRFNISVPQERNVHQFALFFIHPH